MAKQLSRKQSLNTYPIAIPILARESIEGGGERITIAVETRGFQKKVLRLPDTVQKKFDLDEVGLFILGFCDGKNSVRDIINRFMEEYGQHPHESEQAVISFIHTLTRKGLVYLAVPKKMR